MAFRIVQVSDKNLIDLIGAGAYILWFVRRRYVKGLEGLGNKPKCLEVSDGY